MTPETLAIDAITLPPAIYRAPAATTMPMAAQTARFAAALDQAHAAAAERYVRADAAMRPAGAGDAAFDRLGNVAQSMSTGFKRAIDDSFAKLSNLDFTEPAAMITVMEVQLGVFSAATHVQFASKVADMSVHGVTTLFRNQG